MRLKKSFEPLKNAWSLRLERAEVQWNRDLWHSSQRGEKTVLVLSKKGSGFDFVFM
jgi:hypothetical protein